MKRNTSGRSDSRYVAEYQSVMPQFFAKTAIFFINGHLDRFIGSGKKHLYCRRAEHYSCSYREAPLVIVDAIQEVDIVYIGSMKESRGSISIEILESFELLSEKQKDSLLDALMVLSNGLHIPLTRNKN